MRHDELDGAGIYRHSTLDDLVTAVCARKLFIVSGTARPNNDGTWLLLESSTFGSINISSVSVVSGKVRVTYSRTGSRVVTFVVTPDESFATSNIFCGASAGLSSADITLATSAGYLDASTVHLADYPWSNLWIFGILEVV
jgi:hypothetical protein